MDWVNVILTSLSMSVDAMTVGAVDGIKEKEMKLWKMIFISFTFGLFQFAMPVIGYFIGSTFKQYIQQAVPWISFSLLILLAIKSLIDWIMEFKKRKNAQEEIKEEHLSFPGLLVQAVATSIDALCIGFVYMNLSIPNAMLVFGIIGLTTFVLSFLTTYFAHFFANKLEKWGSLIASIVFVAVAIKVLISGLL